jgi:uncharacterized surface protein with fasciclin (FAS1) repeats
VKGLHETAVQLGNLVTWTAAVEIVGLVKLLEDDQYFTVFAPTDQAFFKLPRRIVKELLSDVARLETVLRYHIVTGKIPTSEIPQVIQLRTLLGDDLLVNAKQGLRINQARLVRPNIQCRNGLIHTIDEVLLLRKRTKLRLPV